MQDAGVGVRARVGCAGEVQDLRVGPGSQRRDRRLELLAGADLGLVDDQLVERVATSDPRPTGAEHDRTATGEGDLLLAVRERRHGAELVGETREQPAVNQPRGVGSMRGVEDGLALERVQERIQLADEALAALARDERDRLEGGELVVLVRGEDVVHQELLPAVERVVEALGERDEIAAAGSERCGEHAEAGLDDHRATFVGSGMIRRVKTG